MVQRAFTEEGTVIVIFRHVCVQRLGKELPSISIDKRYRRDSGQLIQDPTRRSASTTEDTHDQRLRHQPCGVSLFVFTLEQDPHVTRACMLSIRRRKGFRVNRRYRAE